MGAKKGEQLFKIGNQVAKGNKGGPGRPKRRIEEDLLRSFTKVMSPERLEKVLEVFACRAEAGDRYAVRLFLDYQLGRPVERVLTAEAKEADLERFFSQLVDAGDGNADSSDSTCASE